MTHRLCRNMEDLQAFGRFAMELAPQLPVRFTWKAKARTLNQNDLAFKWYKEISEQMGDRSPKDVRAECKLCFGVPIRREDDPEFRDIYDAHIRPLPHEAKLALMVEPIDFPVTRDMGIRQMTRYLDAIQREWAPRGIRLTIPEDAA